MTRAWRRLRDEQGGHTLVELLVATLIALFVAGAALLMLNLAVQTQPQISERAGQLQQGRAFSDQILRELRQGEAVHGSTASSLTIVTYVDSTACGAGGSTTARLCRVTYTCGATSCSRSEVNPDGSGTPSTKQVIEGITGPSVFSYAGPSGNPDYVGLRLVYPSDDGSEAVTIEDGVALRNWQEADS